MQRKLKQLIREEDTGKKKEIHGDLSEEKRKKEEELHNITNEIIGKQTQE